MIERKRVNFILNEANFAVECGQFDEKFNKGQYKIFRLKPIDGILNKLYVKNKQIYGYCLKIQFLLVLLLFDDLWLLGTLEQ